MHCQLEVAVYVLVCCVLQHMRSMPVQDLNSPCKGRSAYEASGTMWNSEYVIALILTSSGLSDAVPEGWLEPRGKRNKLPAQTPVPAALLSRKHERRLCQE
jgi:hypothetical protein